jgi:hypothetical protein
LTDEVTLLRAIPASRSTATPGNALSSPVGTPGRRAFEVLLRVQSQSSDCLLLKQASVALATSQLLPGCSTEVTRTFTTPDVLCGQQAAGVLLFLTFLLYFQTHP